jgi:ABC-type oligopeptide transport system ATPase subunit
VEVIIKADNVKKHFSFSKGLFRKKVSKVKAVDGVSLDIYKGEILGLEVRAAAEKPQWPSSF